MRAYSTSVRSSCRTGLPTGEFEMPLPAAWLGAPSGPWAIRSSHSPRVRRRHRTRSGSTRAIHLPDRSVLPPSSLASVVPSVDLLPIRLRRRRLSGTMFGAMTNRQVGLPDLVQVGAPNGTL